ncbi:molybdate transport system ATP-binding protein [Arenibacter nanhaiticus]|uniref:Molybdate transport system ATP-binding protein n=1 Tax=Arenibacter nanhaiticus TaxID=558155 RepID=A0A1M6HKK7_9FLAO|nr:ATP-binding cassette domain-containing protein [Arenibacter nanhaiticus]SHJ22702.1 molybdate transport system ATP-binding protein [Arenibacter nanhaiticus]
MIGLHVRKTLKGSGKNIELELSLDIKKGEFVTLYGESGAGKTSTLRLLSGLLTPDLGNITVDGSVWFDAEKQINLPSQTRKLGYVFQDYALFPHMSVRQNLEFALTKEQASTIVVELLEFMELLELQDRKPMSLSGGQKQRVALARALVQQPEILILDEPLSALDYAMRVKLQAYILRIHKKFKLTTILVSHDIGEIVRMSDRVVELQEGKVIKTAATADFFGLNKASAKFKFTGEIISIQKEDVVYVVGVLIGNELVKVIADLAEVRQLAIGDKVYVASKAFNPILQKI